MLLGSNPEFEMLGNDIPFPKAKPFNPKKLPDGAMIEQKLDGERRIMWPGHSYSTRISDVSGQRENQWDAMPEHIKHFVRMLPKYKSTTYCRMDCELTIENGAASDVKTALAEWKYSRGGPLVNRLRLTAFRLIGATLLMPHEHLEALTKCNIPVPKFLAGKTNLYYHSEAELLEMHEKNEFESKAKSFGYEGWIIKQAVNGYNWWKYKVENEIDLIITGTKDGDGKYLGFIGAIKCSLFEGKELASVSGMTDDERDLMTEMNDNGVLVGKVVTVRYQNVAAKGRLRHPRFVRFRDDKNPKECTAAQLG